MSDYRIEAATKEEWAARALKAEDARDKAIHQLSEISRALGEAEGKLAASEMAGIVEGWKARALTAEAEAEKLKAAFRVNALRWNPSLSHEEIDKFVQKVASGDKVLL